jgi:hypothetical protein
MKRIHITLIAVVAATAVAAGLTDTNSGPHPSGRSVSAIHAGAPAPAVVANLNHR